jgi:hypothetical protein
VQLIFGLEPNDGFQLNGLRGTPDNPGGYIYASSDVWSGRAQPCDTFFSNGTCNYLSTVPEPSSIALLGLGFLALVFGIRRANPIRTRLS